MRRTGSFRIGRSGGRTPLLPAPLLVAVLLVSGGFLARAGVQAAAPTAGDVSALMEQAEAAFAEKRDFADGRRVVALYERVLDADPNYVPALVRLADMHYWLGEVVEEGEALPLLEKGLEYAHAAVELDEANADAHYWSGVLQGRIGEERGILQSLFMVDDVVGAAEKALELNPDHGGAHVLLSQVYRKAPGWPLSVGDKETSLEHALEAARLEPDKTSRWLNLAESYLALKQNEQARENLQKVLDMPLTPNDETVSRMDKERAEELLAELNG